MAFSMDSNSTQAYFGEEATLGVQSPGPWTPLEPNSYSSWGLDVKTVQRETLNISRQQTKGTITELDVAAGFQSDLTQNNLTKLMQGFYFADIIEKPATQPINGTQIAVSSVSATAYTLASALATIVAKMLILGSKFGQPANNGPMLVSGVAGAVITAAPVYGGVTAVEAGPPAAANLKVVGVQLAATAELSGLTIGPATLTDAGGDIDFTALGLNRGEWLYIGDVGNAVGADNFNVTGNVSAQLIRGYARIATIAAHVLTFDFVTFPQGGDATASTTAGLRVWFGSYLQNQQTLATIKRRSYTLPRYLGKGLAAADQLETLLGCVPDKLTITAPTANKVTADLTFVGINAEYSNAAMLDGVINVGFDEDAINTSQDMFASLLTILGTETGSLFQFASTSKIDLDNGATIARALCSASGFDITVGDFKASISATVYFDDISAIEAIQNNADVGYAAIFAARAAGAIFDVPLLTLGGSQLKLEKDKKIMADITGNGSKCAAGYTASYTKLHYLPGPAIGGYTGL